MTELFLASLSVLPDDNISERILRPLDVSWKCAGAFVLLCETGTKLSSPPCSAPGELGISTPSSPDAPLPVPMNSYSVASKLTTAERITQHSERLAWIVPTSASRIAHVWTTGYGQVRN